jgi:hypothetical protein
VWRLNAPHLFKVDLDLLSPFPQIDARIMGVGCRNKESSRGEQRRGKTSSRTCQIDADYWERIPLNSPLKNLDIMCRFREKWYYR